MARVPAIGEGQWFELADALAAGGETPSVKALHALAKERFGVAASFTTIQRILESWRRLGGTYRPSEMTPQALDIVLKGFTPLYQQLLVQARSEFEPRVLEAETQAHEAMQRTQSLEAELNQLRDERLHLREQLRVAGEREREQTAGLASALTKAGELQSLLEANALAQQQQLEAFEARWRDQEERHAREREQVVEQQRAAVTDIRETYEAEAQGLTQRHRTELERVHREIVSLREALQDAQEARSTLSAQKQAVEDQLASALALQTDMRARLDKLGDELKSAHARGERFEQGLRDSRAANAQMEAAYQQRINQLQTQLDSLAQGQAAIQQHFGELVRQLAHGELASKTPRPHG